MTRITRASVRGIDLTDKGTPSSSGHSRHARGSPARNARDLISGDASVSASFPRIVSTVALTHHSTRHSIDMLILDIVVRDDQVVEMPPHVPQQTEDSLFVMVMLVVVFGRGDNRAVRISRLARFSTGQREGRAGSSILFRLR